jgi:hypothetical protein
MDELNERTAAMQLQGGTPPASSSAASCAAAAACSNDANTFVLHVLNLSGQTEDASIELRTDADNYLRFEWKLDQSSSGASAPSAATTNASTLTVDELKRTIVQRLQTLAAAAAADVAPDLPSHPVIELAAVRLVYLTQRVPASDSSSAAAASSSATCPPTSACRPLTDLLTDSRLLVDPSSGYGVSSHSWLLLKRKFLVQQPQQQQQQQQEDEEDGEDEAYEDEQEEDGDGGEYEGYEGEHAAYENNGDDDGGVQQPQQEQQLQQEGDGERFAVGPRDPAAAASEEH